MLVVAGNEINAISRFGVRMSKISWLWRHACCPNIAIWRQSVFADDGRFQSIP
jgi:hypothetical protein